MTDSEMNVLKNSVPVKQETNVFHQTSLKNRAIFIYNNDIDDNELHEFDYEDCEQIGNILSEDIENIKDSIENIFYDSSYAEEMVNEYEEDYDDYMQGKEDEYYDNLRKGEW